MFQVIITLLLIGKHGSQDSTILSKVYKLSAVILLFLKSFHEQLHKNKEMTILAFNKKTIFLYKCKIYNNSLVVKSFD